MRPGCKTFKMKITKRQLRRIIKEEVGRLTEYNPAEEGMYAAREDARIAGDPGPAWDKLLVQLSNAGDLAARIHSLASDSEDWKGTEALDLADLLEQIWVKAGFDPGEIFK